MGTVFWTVGFFRFVLPQLLCAMPSCHCYFFKGAFVDKLRIKTVSKVILIRQQFYHHSMWDMDASFFSGFGKRHTCKIILEKQLNFLLRRLIHHSSAIYNFVSVYVAQRSSKVDSGRI